METFWYFCYGTGGAVSFSGADGKHGEFLVDSLYGGCPGNDVSFLIIML